MFSVKQLLMGVVSGIFLVVSVSPGLAAERHKDRKEKKAFPQASIINKLHSKLVCGKRDPGARFVTSKDGKEVCDRTTGIIWEQNPMSDNPREPENQADAIAFCENLDKGNGQVYALPTFAQLVSVLDYSRINPALEPGVFDVLTDPGPYWSATPFLGEPDQGWFVTLEEGRWIINSLNDPVWVWCIRSDHAANADW